MQKTNSIRPVNSKLGITHRKWTFESILAFSDIAASFR